MKAIITKYHGATSTKPAKVTASAEPNHRLTLSWESATMDGEDGHARAAIALCQKLGWYGELIPGGTKDGYVFVFKNDDRNLYRVPRPV